MFTREYWKHTVNLELDENYKDDKSLITDEDKEEIVAELMSDEEFWEKISNTLSFYINAKIYDKKYTENNK